MTAGPYSAGHKSLPCQSTGYRYDRSQQSRKPEKRSGPMDDRFLKTGVFLAPFHPLDENPLLALDRDMELLVHLDRLNYHEAWIGEHHSGGFEILPARNYSSQALPSAHATSASAPASSPCRTTIRSLFFFVWFRPTIRSTLFPYTTLFR